MLNSRPNLALVAGIRARHAARARTILAPMLCAVAVGAFVVVSPALAGLCGIVGAYLLAKEG